MRSARELAAIVSGSKADRAAYRGVSDHTPNAQRFTFADGFNVVIATFNVLNPAYLFYQNGLSQDDKPLPSWLKMEDQAGLEHCPASDPLRQVERESVIFGSILQFLTSHERVVLCLQECWPALEKQLWNSATTLGFEVIKQPLVAKSYPLTLVRGDMKVQYLGDVSIRINDTIIVDNVHMGFNTEDNHEIVKHCLKTQATWHYIVGDFNIQTQLLSLGVLEDGACTDTLTEFSDRFAWPEFAFAVHPRGWTNWNVRKNCADREKNWDHFDNIMLCTGIDTPLPLVEPILWDVTLQ
jgi:hypothetical protein